MAPREPNEDQRRAIDDDSAPGIAQTDWDDIGTSALEPTDTPANGDLRYPQEEAGDLPEEDDDNPFEESDEALPDDEEERALARNPGKEGSRFDEV